MRRNRDHLYRPGFPFRWAVAGAWLLAAALVPYSVKAADAVAAPLAADEALQSFQLADPQLRIELVAAEPLVASPCALAWDDAGRLFVAENRGYPQTDKPAQGVIARLEDTDRDGRMDRRTVFAEDLTFPNGVLWWYGGVIVTCAPDVLFLRDTDGDGVADERRVLLTGFATNGSTQLRVNAPTLGPDGWIYLASGLSGGTITCPSHPERPALKMTSDVRFHPDTLEVENVDGRSQFGQSFDEYGRRFICMNRVPVQQVVLSSRWLRRNPQLAFSDTVQDANERSVKTGLKGGGDGVRLFPISANVTTADSHAGSFSAACGIHVWKGGVLLPVRYRGAAFSCDPTGNLVHADRLVPHGATFGAEPMFAGKEFLASRDDWFRPVYLAAGRDGALYVADMYRKVIEHPDYLPEEVRKRTDFESGKEMGRIWRIRAEKPRRPAAASGAAELMTAAREGRLDSMLLQEAANNSNAEMRQLALRLWLEYPGAREWKPDPAVLGHDDDPHVRFMAALALGEIPEGTAALADIAASDARTFNPQAPLDRWTRAAVLSSVAGREAEFLRLYLEAAEQMTPSTPEFLTALGGYFRDLATLRKALEGTGVWAAGRAGIRSTLAALLLGLSERTRQPLKMPEPPDEWLTPLLQGIPSAAGDFTLSTEERLLYVRLLGHMEWSLAGPALLRLAGGAEEDSLCIAAMRSLTMFSQPEVASSLLGPDKWNSYSPILRETVLSALLANPAHLEGILNAINVGNLPAAAISTTRRATFLRSKNEALRLRAEKLWSAPPVDRQQALTAAKAALALPANARNGQAVFKNLCSTCHRLDREGFALGPDLLDVRNQPKESTLFHLVVPEAEVNVAYAPYAAETKDGRTIAGILSSETPSSITLRQPLGVEETLLRANLAKLEALPGTLMPAGLDQAMSKQELADLLAYLKGE